VTHPVILLAAATAVLISAGCRTPLVERGEEHETAGQLERAAAIYTRVLANTGSKAEEKNRAARGLAYFADDLSKEKASRALFNIAAGDYRSAYINLRCIEELKWLVPSAVHIETDEIAALQEHVGAELVAQTRDNLERAKEKCDFRLGRDCLSIENYFAPGTHQGIGDSTFKIGVLAPDIPMQLNRVPEAGLIGDKLSDIVISCLKRVVSDNRHVDMASSGWGQREGIRRIADVDNIPGALKRLHRDCGLVLVVGIEVTDVHTPAVKKDRYTREVEEDGVTKTVTVWKERRDVSFAVNIVCKSPTSTRLRGVPTLTCGDHDEIEWQRGEERPQLKTAREMFEEMFKPRTRLFGSDKPPIVVEKLAKSEFGDIYRCLKMYGKPAMPPDLAAIDFRDFAREPNEIGRKKLFLDICPCPLPVPPTRTRPWYWTWPCTRIWPPVQISRPQYDCGGWRFWPMAASLEARDP